MTLPNKIVGLLDFLANPQKDIEVFGMFGPGNLGDEAMLVAAGQALSPRRIVPSRRYPARPLLNGLVERRRRKHLLVGGGTLIHGGDTGWLDYVEMRARQGVEVSFFGTGMAFAEHQIVNESDPYRRWRAILRQARHVHLRGPDSVGLAERMGVRAGIFGDFGFLLHRPGLAAANRDRQDGPVGLSLGECLGDQDAFEDACVALVERLSRDHRLAFHVAVRTDLPATERVIARAGLAEGQYGIEAHYFDPYAFMHAISGYRVFLGLKLHAAGFAMVAGVPALMIAYLPKCHDFMAPLNADPRMTVPLPLDVDDVLARIGDVLADPRDFVVADRIAAIAATQRGTLARVYG
ncbi:hypothetical protein OCGS_1340 [Oceaniovalibus guishaninsula JLT2003]|uniref:Polysaccharide pyruvyl transferase domain-containing protein n=1 Tax=Oceaniovalibus guishaninsula JLT2003 TaxID=1231392 RepID=K2HD39_9RHOB|nr:polysaccharide pyruvyl transferase family protein [Oceaniovalibus guishaninsula]EKE44502.1 hypothetical protein OCGS_1340 [Oceaniovalibus guishaninsula JLT2003]